MEIFVKLLFYVFFALNWREGLWPPRPPSPPFLDQLNSQGCSLDFEGSKGKCKCIRNWPLPIGAFHDQCKQIVINKHSLAKNPNWRETDQLAIYKRRREVELGATENNIS